jgi:alpha-1,2-glucosyltransferase
MLPPVTWWAEQPAHCIPQQLPPADTPLGCQDEPFHVPMTQRYCNGDFGYWDPKITTFPGLYVLGSGYAGAAAAAVSWMGPTQVKCLLTSAIAQTAFKFTKFILYMC